MTCSLRVLSQSTKLPYCFFSSFYFFVWFEELTIDVTSFYRCFVKHFGRLSSKGEFFNVMVIKTGVNTNFKSTMMVNLVFLTKHNFLCLEHLVNHLVNLSCFNDPKVIMYYVLVYKARAFPVTWQNGTNLEKGFSV